MTDTPTYTPRPHVIPTDTFVALATLAYKVHRTDLYVSLAKALNIKERNAQRWLAGSVAPPAPIVARVVCDAADAHDRYTIMLDECETDPVLSPLIQAYITARNNTG